MKKFNSIFVVLSVIVVSFPIQLALAQLEDELELRLSRDFGYSSGAGKIQGTFTASVVGPEDLMRVTFYLDGQLMGETSQLPFKLRFNTDGFPLGVHTMYALGDAMDGRLLHSNEIRLEFVSAEEGWKAGMRFAAPLFAIVLIAVGLSFLFMILTSGKQRALPPGSPRKYGISGGAICPRCKRPFSRHFFSPNFLTGKLERCPFCGKWSIVRAVSMTDLHDAEEAELGAHPESDQALSQDELRKELDDSRFLDL